MCVWISLSLSLAFFNLCLSIWVSVFHNVIFLIFCIKPDVHVLQKSGSRDIRPQSWDFFSKKWKNCVQRKHFKNGKCYRKYDLIFGIYDRFSFPYVSSDFCVVLRVSIWVEKGQFSSIFWLVFGHFLSNRLYFGNTWPVVRPERLDTKQTQKN